MGTAPWFTVEITFKRGFVLEEDAREWFEGTKKQNSEDWEGRILYHSGGDEKPEIIKEEKIEF